MPAKEIAQKASHIAYMVSDLDRSVAFYRDVIGLELVDDIMISEIMGRSVRRAFLSCPGFAVELFEAADKFPPKPSLGEHGYNALSFVVADLEAQHKRLVDLGASIPIPPFSTGPGSKIMLFLDPDGNGLEFVEYEQGCDNLAEVIEMRARLKSAPSGSE